jgi:transketolase
VVCGPNPETIARHCEGERHVANQPGIDKPATNTIRLPVIDAVQKARSGHSGTPMDAAPAYALWQWILRYDRADPAWINRDRFVLSNGHASMLLDSRRELPAGWEGALAAFPPSQSGRSTPCASGQVLNAVAHLIPWLTGGAADLAPRTKTPMTFEAAGDFQADGPLGDHRSRNLHFGIRDTMCATLGDMTLCGPRAFGSGFFIFTDPARGSIRLASLPGLPALHIWTHASISVGKDGPTHEPIEQLVSLRAIPEMIVIRLADANEISEPYSLYLSAPRPTGQLDLLVAGAAHRRSREPGSRRRSGQRHLRARRAAERQTGRHRCCRRQRGHIVIGGARPTDRPRYQRAHRHHALIGGTAVGDGEGDRRGTFAAGLGPLWGPAGIALGTQTFGMPAPMKVPAEHFGFTADAVAAAAKPAQRHTPNL